MIIVLVTSGKRDSFDKVTVKLFNSEQEAIFFCHAKCDKINEYKKYWTFAEIIKEGVEYEPSRYENY